MCQCMITTAMLLVNGMKMQTFPSQLPPANAAACMRKRDHSAATLRLILAALQDTSSCKGLIFEALLPKEGLAAEDYKSAAPPSKELHDGDD